MDRISSDAVRDAPESSARTTPWTSRAPALVDKSEKQDQMEKFSNTSNCPSIDISPSNLEAGSTSCSFTVPSESPYHIFTRRKKWVLVYLVSLAGMFSPLSSNIYFPAINTISQDLKASNSLIALTITVYMIVQGIAPSFWGPWSDTCGRRLIFCFTIGIYIFANLALSFTINMPMLLVLRGIQAAGSAATISIGTGVIADIAMPSERGGFIGTNSGIRMIGQALGPVLGGILNSVWGFRSIFWLLFAMSVLVLLLVLTVLPETHRAIAGNGSVPLHGIHKPWIHFLTSPPNGWSNTPTTPKAKTPPLSFKKVLTPLTHLFEKDILALLSWGALIYTVWSMITSSTTTVLKAEFPSLTPLQLGLCFLPNGLGCVLGSILTGRLMDHTYRRAETHFRAQHNIPPNIKLNDDKNFPYERARLSPMPYLSLVFMIATALYGASYEFNHSRPAIAYLGVPLVLQFFVAYTATAVFGINSAMMVDCFPTGGAGAAAVNNLARCSLGAVGVSVIQPMIDALGVRTAFVVLAAVVLGCSPLVWVEWWYGEGWRLEREDRKEKEAEERGLEEIEK